jgi:antirestriction protein ArdC
MRSVWQRLTAITTDKEKNEMAINLVERTETTQRGKERMKTNEIITQRIVDALNSGIIPWRRPWEALEVMSVDGRPYRGINRMLLSWAGYTDPRFLTFRKCGELGGNVRKGEKGFPVVLWHFGRKKVKTQDEHGKEVFQYKEVPFLRYYVVFNVEQCDGIADKLKPLEQKTIAFHHIEAAKDIVSGYANPPRIEHGGSEACYSPTTDTVRLPHPETFLSVEAYYSTLFHELCHSTGHVTRLDRNLSNSYSEELYSKEELIAEIGSAFLRAEAHIDSPAVDDNTIAYIQSWAMVLQSDPNMVIQASGKAQRAVDYIIGRQALVEEPVDEQEECERARVAA